MKRLLFFCLLISTSLLLPALAKRLTDGFRPAKMVLAFPHHPEWEVPFSNEILPILNQPYRYMDKGSQCYVFESQDGEYVVKFFRFDRTEKKGKILTLFNACKIAYDRLREETGLIYLHLNPDQTPLPILQCRDRLGRKYQFPLNECRFAVQKKVKPFRQTLQEALTDPLLMQKRIDQFLSLLIVRTSKGVYNTDPTLSRNFGFLPERAIELDFGNYRPSGAHIQAVEIARYTEKLRRWLKAKAPEYVDYLDQQTKALQ
jgi:hypothetical protein